MTHRTIASPRPSDRVIRRMLGIPEPTELNKGPPAAELHARADAYQLPNLHQTRSYNTQGAGSMDLMIRQSDDANAWARMPDGIHRDVVACVLKRVPQPGAALVQLMRKELRIEQESRRDAFDAADECVRSLEGYDDCRAELMEAAQLAAHCRAERWPDWSDPYIVMPNAVLNELAGGHLLGHRERAHSLGRSKFSFTSAWRAPYEWLHARYNRIYRAGLEMLDELKGAGS